MNTKVIYDIFLTSAKNHCTDLAVQALPMLLHDARTGKRKYTDEQTDLEQLHRDYESIAAQDNQLCQFIGRHYKALVDAYQLGDRAAFDAAAAQCEAADREAEEHAQSQSGKEVEADAT